MFFLGLFLFFLVKIQLFKVKLFLLLMGSPGFKVFGPLNCQRGPLGNPWMWENEPLEFHYDSMLMWFRILEFSHFFFLGINKCLIYPLVMTCQFAMEWSTVLLIGKPSISIRAIYFPWRTVSHNQRVPFFFCVYPTYNPCLLVLELHEN
jgi:hypothetical protein